VGGASGIELKQRRPLTLGRGSSFLHVSALAATAMKAPMDAAAADAFWTELEERDAERRAPEGRLELHDLVSRNEDASFGISAGPCWIATAEKG
jgi:hypothetical protein